MNSRIRHIAMLVGVAAASWIASAHANAIPAPVEAPSTKSAMEHVRQLANSLPAMDSTSHIIDVHPPVTRGDTVSVTVVIRRKNRCAGNTLALAQPQHYAIYERRGGGRWLLTKLGLMAPPERLCS